MGRVGRRLIPYGVIGGEYLLAAGTLDVGLRMMTPAPSPRGCIDTCWGASALFGFVSISGWAVLAVGLLVALVVLAAQRRRAEHAGRVPTSGWAAVGAASIAAAIGMLWGVIALPALWCGGLAGFKLFQYSVTMFRLA